MGKLTKPEAVLATNSSSIPVSWLEEACGRPEQCLNLHFYMVLLGQNMVDVMGGSRTRPDVLEAGKAFVRSLDCLPLTVKKELLGFCFNRVWRAIKKEVLYMWANGFVDFRDVDRGWRVFTGMSDGPFSFMDKVGLDVIYGIEMVYYNDSKDPRDHPPQALKEMVDRGELGMKTGKGFYTYPDPEFMEPDFMDPKAD
jgi:3-hydroxybutyryl-CoA dehydrogenase